MKPEVLNNMISVGASFKEKKKKEDLNSHLELQETEDLARKEVGEASQAEAAYCPAIW